MHGINRRLHGFAALAVRLVIAEMNPEVDNLRLVHQHRYAVVVGYTGIGEATVVVRQAGILARPNADFVAHVESLLRFPRRRRCRGPFPER